MGRRLPSRRQIIHRALALAMALEALIAIRPASGDPADLFTVAAPAVTDTGQKAPDIADGDASVSTQTGALTYSFTIKTPPGRAGIAPHLSLSYSSQAPVYGTLASGWAL